MRFIVLGHTTRPRKGETGHIEYFGASKEAAREVMAASEWAVVELVTISRFGLLKHKGGQTDQTDPTDPTEEATPEAAAEGLAKPAKKSGKKL